MTVDCTMHEISSGPSGVPSRPYGRLLGRGVFAEGFPPQDGKDSLTTRRTVGGEDGR